MRRGPFYVRCYAKKDGDQWVAVCVDLCLAAQADSYEDAKRKLDSQVRDYVFEALTVDQEHAAELLARKAPLANRIEYWVIRARQMLSLRKHRTTARKPRSCAFEELVNPVPA